MREDMQKVIVERPRHGGRGLIYKPRRRGEDWENFPLREGLRRRTTSTRSGAISTNT
jgi:hypothetical protein